MKYLIPPLLAAVMLGGTLPSAELHRLAAYQAYIVTCFDEAAPCDPAPCDPVAGDWCPDCTPGGVPLFPSRPGMVGDGTVFLKCGLCDGTQKVQGESIANDFLPLDDIEPCEGTQKVQSESIANDFLPLIDIEPCEPVQQIGKSGGSRWTFENRGTDPPIEFVVQHLTEVHGVDVDGLTLESMKNLHDNLHNGRPNVGSQSSPTDPAVGTRSSSSCPTGTCPTGTRSGATSRRGLFGRRR